MTEKLRPILEIAEELGLKEDELELDGKYIAKVSFRVLERLRERKTGKYIFVTAITPTPAGEGKTVTAIGLSQALNRIGKKTICTLRQPSMGPLFGLKGGATGGGKAQVLPKEEINLHFTGDFHAVGYAHNLLSAILDTHLQKGNKLCLDISEIFWPRVVDIDDRALRHIIIGLGGKADGIPRESYFDITPASEVMSILSLSTGLEDLNKRLSRITVGIDQNKKMICASDLKSTGAMAVILKKAFNPNLVQTSEGTPAFIHTGPFANISHGNSSVIADLISLKLSDFVVTESGFGADCGAEKLMDIKCRESGLTPDLAVLVATVKSLMMHGIGVYDKKAIDQENLETLEKGCGNLQKHIQNLKLFGLPVLVAINRFPEDSEAELLLLKEKSLRAGADDVAVAEMFDQGGQGGIELAEKAVRLCQRGCCFKFLYQTGGIKEKIETIAKKIYGAGEVLYFALAEKKIDLFKSWGLDNLPMCIAKTPYSFSHDPKLKGRPEGFRLPIEDLRPATGAGYLYALAGDIMTMPGLPTNAAAFNFDLDKDGNITGLT
ncbi:MAG TPA: formate--tetrahydrofolate ligase [Terriglobales bacterium]|nr:formate--tetrahydrofolate ligase [Terriglobales bacterium]